MKVKFNKEVLNIINAVKDYKKFIVSNNYIINKDNFDWYAETVKYYYSLPLPTGLNTSIACFESILDYPKEELNILNNKNYSDLHYHEFGY